MSVLRFDAPPLLVDTSKGSLHWSPAIWQSVEFLGVEHTFRIASDPYARYLLIHKPFWHDYLASANHFDMYRWGDGDDFLVNYIGHPIARIRLRRHFSEQRSAGTVRQVWGFVGLLAQPAAGDGLGGGLLGIFRDWACAE